MVWTARTIDHSTFGIRVIYCRYDYDEKVYYTTLCTVGRTPASPTQYQKNAAFDGDSSLLLSI